MFLFSSDIDGTVYWERGTERHDQLFRDGWESLQKEVPERAAKRVLVYNSGRSVANMLRLLDHCVLPRPRYLIGSVGTEIYDYAEQRMLEGWQEKLRENWDKQAVDAWLKRTLKGAKLQPDECQNEFKSSWYWRERSGAELEALRAEMAHEGLPGQLVYSSGRDLDVLPAAANKGGALGWLAGRLAFKLSQVVVAGDSGNDAAMFLLPKVRGILPSNAGADLRAQLAGHPHHYRATHACSGGVLEGLRQYQGGFQATQPDHG